MKVTIIEPLKHMNQRKICKLANALRDAALKFFEVEYINFSMDIFGVAM